MNDLQLRPAQEKILEYENGRLAISAVPGSGKTFTLSLLTAKLIGDGRIALKIWHFYIVEYLCKERITMGRSQLIYLYLCTF